MKLFVPQDSNDETKAIGVMLSLLFLGLIILGITTMSEGGVLLVGLCLIVGVPTLILTKKIKKCGLYIDGERIYYKRLNAKEYSINDIKGVMILTHQVQGSHKGFASLFRIKTKDYTITYLNEILPEFYSFEKGDLDFEDLYSNRILFRTVHNESVLEYFREKNVPIINRVQIN